MAGGKAIRTSDGKAIRTSDGKDLRTGSDDACPGYAMTPCAGGDATLALRDADNTDSATTGDFVLYSVDGLCYTLGCRSCLTPTSGSASKVDGDCTADDCAQLYLLTPCCGGFVLWGISQSDLDSIGASVGSVVMYNGMCFTVASKSSGLTRVSPVTLKSGCSDETCPSDICPDGVTLKTDTYKFDLSLSNPIPVCQFVPAMGYVKITGTPPTGPFCIVAGVWTNPPVPGSGYVAEIYANSDCTDLLTTQTFEFQGAPHFPDSYRVQAISFNIPSILPCIGSSLTLPVIIDITGLPSGTVTFTPCVSCP